MAEIDQTVPEGVKTPDEVPVIETALSSAQPAPETEVPSSKVAPSIDPVLIEKLAQLKGIVKIDSILDNCLIPGGAAADILGAKQVLQKLHAPLLAECQAHPDFAKASTPPSPQPTPADLQRIAEAEQKRNRKERRAAN